MLLRKDLYTIYAMLSDSQKNDWAANSNYASYSGLYRYLKTNPMSPGYDRVTNGLRATVGDCKFQELIHAVETNNICEDSAIDSFEEIIKDVKTKVVPNILASDNIKSLEEAMSVFEICLTLCKNKVESLKLVNSISKS